MPEPADELDPGLAVWRAAAPASTLITSDLDGLLSSAVCLARPVLVGEVVCLDDELLVGLTAFGGRWFLPEHPDADPLGFVDCEGPTPCSVPLPCPFPISRRLATARLTAWRRQASPLVAARSVQRGQLGLVDLNEGVALVGPL